MTAAAWTISTHLLSFNSEFMTLNIWRHTVAAGCVTVWVLILWYIWTVFFLWNHFIVLFIIIKSLCLIAAVWTLSPEVLLLLCVCVCVCARVCVCVLSLCLGWSGSWRPSTSCSGDCKYFSWTRHKQEMRWKQSYTPKKEVNMKIMWLRRLFLLKVWIWLWCVLSCRLWSQQTSDLLI